MVREQIRFAVAMTVFQMVHVLGLTLLAQRYSLLAVAPVIAVELVVVPLVLYRLMPRYFPRMSERDRVLRALRSGGMRHAVGVAARCSLGVLALMAPPIVFAVAAATYMRSLDPFPPLAVYLGVLSGVWFAYGIGLLVFRRQIRAWFARRGLAPMEG